MKTFEDFINTEFALLNGLELNDDTIFALKRRIIKDMRMMRDDQKFYSMIISMIVERAKYLEERAKLLDIPENPNP